MVSRIEAAPKDPAAVIDYPFDWSGWLADGETIASHEITVTGATLDSDSEDAGVVTPWVSGGEAGDRATITCRITTSIGRTDERTRLVRIRDR